MNRIFPAFLLLLSAAPGASAQPVNQLDASLPLFTVMAAINAAGYDADLSSPYNSPVRMEVRSRLAGSELPSVGEMRRFFAAHRKEDWNAELTQYLSFALLLDSAPGFDFRLKTQELPPDVQKLDGLQPIIRKFYTEAKIEDLWRAAQPYYDAALEKYHGPVTQSLLEANAYLRNPTSGYLGRRFVVYLDLLAAPHGIQSRNYKDDYFVVLTPSPELHIAQIRYAYLHYLLDPLALKYSEQLETKKPLADLAQAAPALDDVYKNDFQLLATGSLIRAIESRLARGEATRQAMVDEALREGFVYTPAFAEGLVAYEKQPQSMRLYFPELVNGINLAKEDRRLRDVQFASVRPAQKIRAPEAPAAPPLTGAAKLLGTAEDLYHERSLDKAKASYSEVLQQTADPALHAQAYYGLARIAALQKNPEAAEKLFQKSLESGPTPETRSWVYLYLGRLAWAAGDRNEAEKNYRAVLALAGASQAARSAAEKELKGGVTRQP